MTRTEPVDVHAIGFALGLGLTPAPPAPPTARASADPTLPMSWRLADAGGDVWEHADLLTLQKFIFGRNNRISAGR